MPYPYPPVVHRLDFPHANYLVRGAPPTRKAKFTTYGYETRLVGVGPGRLAQLAKPQRDQSSARPLHNACVVRPERGLSVRQIIAGEYFNRPNSSRYCELVREARRAAADVKAKPSTASYAMEHSSMYASRRPLVPSQSAPLPALADLGAASAAREIGSATLRGSALWSGLDD